MGTLITLDFMLRYILISWMKFNLGRGIMIFFVTLASEWGVDGAEGELSTA